MKMLWRFLTILGIAILPTFLTSAWGSEIIVNDFGSGESRKARRRYHSESRGVSRTCDHHKKGHCHATVRTPGGPRRTGGRFEIPAHHRLAEALDTK